MRSTARPFDAAPAFTLGREWTAAAAAFRTGLMGTLAGWPVLLGRSLFFVLIMVVISSLWDRVMAERGALASTIAPGVLVLYVGVTEWITLSVPSAHLRLEDDIRSGGLEPHLLRPKAYLAQVFAQNYGSGVARLAALGVTALALLAVSGRAWPPAEAFPYVLLLGPLGLAVGVLLYMLAGLAAFWTRRVLPFMLVIQKLMFLAGGLFAPVSLYPEPFRRIAEASPFAAHLYWAGRQAMAPSLPAFAEGLAWCAVWIVSLALLNLAIWRAGLGKVLREGL